MNYDMLQDLSQEHFENWLSFVYSKLDYETCNAITLLRYKITYREKLSIGQQLLFILLCYSYLNSYGQVKTKR